MLDNFLGYGYIFMRIAKNYLFWYLSELFFVDIQLKIKF